MDILNIHYFDLLVQNGLIRFTFQKYPDEVDDCKQVSLYTKSVIAKNLLCDYKSTALNKMNIISKRKNYRNSY